VNESVQNIGIADWSQRAEANRRSRGLHATAGIVAGVGLALLLAGCAARAKTPPLTAAAPKPAVPTPPLRPTPLSIPQTQVELPKPQPIDPAALPAETQPAPVAETPPPPRPQPAPPPRRSTPPRPETTTTPPAAQPESTRLPVQEVIPAADLKRLQESAQSRKREVARILQQVNPKRMTQAQKNVLASVQAFVTMSDDFEKRNEMRQADALAERALILARDLQHGK